MPNYLTCEIVLVGRSRPLRLPRIGPANVVPALLALDHWRDEDEISEAVAGQAVAVLKAIERVGTP